MRRSVFGPPRSEFSALRRAAALFASAARLDVFALLLGLGATALLGSCGAPTLTLYTLGAPSTASDTVPLGKKLVVIAVARVTVPDELDT
jgi:uncharacterized lipoprotein YmbA